MKRTNKKGFTIVELVIVIAVIAILAAVLIPNISRLVKKANESSDIQAVRNMNTFLAAEGATGDVNSILDVYDIFADSGYNVDSYSPLYSGRHFYYDKQYNQILYVETKTNKVLFPEERKNEDIVTLRDTKSHDLFSLSMEVPGEKAPSGYTKPDNNGKITATIKDAKEYAFIIKEYNKNASAQELELTINGTIDMMGAQCLIEKAKGNITIQAATEANGKAVIKNATSNTFVTTSSDNLDKLPASYNSSALIGDAAGFNVTITGITFENLHVKAVSASGCALLVGNATAPSNAADRGKTVTIKNVTIKNSSVIGHRNVGAFVGQASNVKFVGNVSLENVDVKTVGGRSALLVGLADGTCSKASGADIQIDKNSKMSIYENAASEQKFYKELPTDLKTNAASRIYTIGEQDQFIYSVYTVSEGEKKYCAYGYKADALILLQNTPNDHTKLTAITADTDIQTAND